MRQEQWRLKELGTLTEELKQRRRRHGSDPGDEIDGGDDEPSQAAA